MPCDKQMLSKSIFKPQRCGTGTHYHRAGATTGFVGHCRGCGNRRTAGFSGRSWLSCVPGLPVRQTRADRVIRFPAAPLKLGFAVQHKALPASQDCITVARHLMAPAVCRLLMAQSLAYPFHLISVRRSHRDRTRSGRVPLPPCE